MDGIPADPDAAADRIEAEPIPPAELEDGPNGAATPHLSFAGFSGPLHHLLTLARAQKINLAEIPLAALADQLAAALKRATEHAREGTEHARERATTPLGRMGDWMVMAAWLVQLRSLLLLPADAPGRQDAAVEADQLRDRLAALQALHEMQALAGWLERRPQLGREVFARGQPEAFGVAVDAGPAIDAVEFLWASLALFDDGTAPEPAPTYRPKLHLELYSAVEARARILQRLADLPEGETLGALLPEAAGASRSILRRRAAWSSTLIASLELAKQGDVVLGQDMAFGPIHVAPA
jgi:segregation and condensation protein A